MSEITLWDLVTDNKLPLKCPICHSVMLAVCDSGKCIQFECRNGHKWTLEIEQ